MSEIRKALERCRDFLKSYHRSNANWHNDGPTRDFIRDVIDRALSTPSDEYAEGVEAAAKVAKFNTERVLDGTSAEYRDGWVDSGSNIESAIRALLSAPRQSGEREGIVAADALGYVASTLPAGEQRTAALNISASERARAAVDEENLRELVSAARVVAFEDTSPEAIKRLDAATEAFAERFPWDNDPDRGEHLAGGR